jgi:hypothetical protein
MVPNNVWCQIRIQGNDWTYLGHTMVGLARLRNLRALPEDVIHHGIEGYYIETGVW